MTDHTPGPWNIDVGKIGAIAIIGDAMQLTALVYGGTPSAQAANARLIAAAPDLLAALIESRDRNKLHHDGDAELFEIQTAAIAKATSP